MSTRRLLPFVFTIHLLAQDQPTPAEVLERVRGGGSLVEVTYRRGDDGQLQLRAKSPEDASVTETPLLGERLRDGLQSAGAAGLLALCCHGDGDLLAMTDGERHLTWLGVDVRDAGLRQFVATPLPAGQDASARAAMFDRMVAIDLLRRRGCRPAEVELRVLAERADTPPPLRERAKVALAALRGEPSPIARSRLDPATLRLPAAFDACIVVDHARLPDLSWVTPFGRRTGMLVTASTVVTFGGEPSEAIWQSAQRVADLCSELPFGAALHFGNARVDHSCLVVTVQPTEEPPFALALTAAGSFDAARWQAAEVDAEVGEEMRGFGGSLEVTEGLTTGGIRAGKGRPRPELAAKLLADTGAAIRVVAPGTSKLWPALAFLDLPPATEGELRLGFGDTCRIDLLIATRDEESAEAWVARGKQLLGTIQQDVAGSLPPALVESPEMKALLAAIAAAAVKAEGNTALATIEIRDFDRLRLIKLLETLL